MIVSYEQQCWLRTRGGRDTSDVIPDNGNLFVYMWKGDKSGLVKVPDTNKIRAYLNGDNRIAVEVYN